MQRKKEVKKINNKLDALLGIGTLGEGNLTVEVDMTKIEAKLNAIQNVVAGIEGGQDVDLTSVESQLSAIQTSINNLALGDVTIDLSTVEAKLTAIQNALGEIENGTY